MSAGGEVKPTVLHAMEAFAGGTERHLLDLVAHVQGFHHVIAVPSVHHARSTSHAAALAERAGARVELIEMSRSRSAHRNLTAMIALRRLLRRLAPDIVHAHSSIAGVVARLAAGGLTIPLVYSPHALSRSPWAIAVERALSRRVDRFIAVSASERDFLLGQRLATPDRVIVVPNGIDLEPPPPPRQPLRALLSIKSDAPLVGCLGRLTHQKAPEVYLAACAIVHARIPEAQFVLIGSGPLRRAVQHGIEQHGLAQSFHLLPVLRDAAATFGELDAYVLPSRFEGAPYTPLEAMRAGTPVIVTDVDGNRDTVQNGANGLVVPPDDPEALAHAIVTVLEDEHLRAALVEGARRTLGRFAVHRMAAATAAVYAQLLHATAR
jgi:glycosyltransferase involved in cell wall biosynthesis